MMRDRAKAESASGVEDSVVSVGPLRIDTTSFIAQIGTEQLTLTYKEFELLHYLAAHPGRVISRDTLLQEVWGYDYFGGSRTVDVHIKRLRESLMPVDAGRMIETVRGAGYRLLKDRPAAG